MSIIPASRLSASDLSRLGNNLAPGRRPRPSIDRQARRLLAPVNRSLARIGERVDRLTLAPQPIRR